VTGDVITRLERRIDDMVSSVRDEMKETHEIMLKAITGRSSGGSPLSPSVYKLSRAAASGLSSFHEPSRWTCCCESESGNEAFNVAALHWLRGDDCDSEAPIARATRLRDGCGDR
jgi:hypothetical protein